MNRRRLITGISSLSAIALFGMHASRVSSRNNESAASTAPISFQPLVKTEQEWQQILSPDAFRVLRLESTERPFSSPLDKEKRAGTFVCAGCLLPLFDSSTKYDSGTGWPSFWQAIEGSVATKPDFLLFIPRSEYHCARCGGHQGHIFDDGPRPTGKRYCNNGLALKFVPKDQPLPDLRT